LINEKSNFIVPYNVYGLITYQDGLYDPEDLKSATGMYKVMSPKLPKNGFINYLGKIIYTPPVVQLVSMEMLDLDLMVLPGWKRSICQG